MSENNNPRLEQVLDGAWGADHASGDVWSLDDDFVPDFRPAAGGGGGSQPVTREQFDGPSATTIADGATGVLEWESYLGDVPLLDLTDPALPTVIVTGVYAISLFVSSPMMTADGSYQVVLDMDQTNEDAQQKTDSAPATTEQPNPVACVTLIYYVPAGGVIKASVTNHDGAASRDFVIGNATVQRIA